jgi:hypothetical protein
MSERSNEAEQDAVAMLPPGDSDFDRLMALVAVVADAKGCAQRIKELRAAVDAANRARAALDAIRAEHDQHVARTTAELAALRTRLAAQQLQLDKREAGLNERHKYLSGFAADLTAQSGRFRAAGPGGLVQEFVDVSPPKPDPHFQ